MSSFQAIGKFLILFGASLVLFGLLMVFWPKIPLLGKLPGDISVQKSKIKFFFPMVTCLIVSAILTILANLVIRLIR